MARGKSEWLISKEKVVLSEANRKAAELADELIRQIRTNASFITDPSAFSEYLNDPQVTVSDKNTLKDYMGLLSKERLSYDNLKFYELLTPANKTVAAVVTDICQTYQSQNDKTFQDTLEVFMPIFAKVENIIDKYKHIRPRDVNVSLMIRPRAMFALYPIIFQRLSDALQKTELKDVVDEALVISQRRQAFADALYKVNHLLVNDLDSRAKASSYEMAVLNHLIFSWEFTVESDEYSQYSQSLVLEHMLAIAYPDRFGMVDHVMMVKGRDANEICNALGVKPLSSLSLDPRRFSKDRLTELSGAPVFAVLNAIKPIDGEFTLIDKVDAFHTLIKLAKEGRLKVVDAGNFGSALQTQGYPLAEKLLEMVKQRVQQYPKEDTLALREHMDAIYKTISLHHLPRALIGITPLEVAYKDFNRRDLNVVSQDVERTSIDSMNTWETSSLDESSQSTEDISSIQEVDLESISQDSLDERDLESPSDGSNSVSQPSEDEYRMAALFDSIRKTTPSVPSPIVVESNNEVEDTPKTEAEKMKDRLVAQMKQRRQAFDDESDEERVSQPQNSPKAADDDSLEAFDRVVQEKKQEMLNKIKSGSAKLRHLSEEKLKKSSVDSKGMANRTEVETFLKKAKQVLDLKTKESHKSDESDSDDEWGDTKKP